MRIPVFIEQQHRRRNAVVYVLVSTIAAGACLAGVFLSYLVIHG